MSQLVVSGAMLQCSFGVAPCSLVVLPTNRVMCSTPAANIMDYIPMVNVPGFAMCTSLANPTVAAATAAALGVLTPMPCIPSLVAPWITGSPTVLLGKMPALNDSSTLMCMWAGSISIVSAGQFTTTVP
ncbi:DUF4280 domain-containing protein [Desulfovibrio sp. UCD-KL4C]|uniref:DUF4280 domain-containing protein n=1 Tax=Desulfovibrio sp. UCD-KL4C TaxID=2578120 RepID=UPI0025B81F98|nr:DUF4280 domain-containing protein [Desulfovibrio sp. UCD-KL4C]